MQNQIKINGIKIDTSKLMTKQTFLDHLEENGATDRALAEIREQYYKMFGNELMWHYPISDGMHAGVMIVVVQEGFISLPYHEIDIEEYELFELNHVAMFDEDSLGIFIDDWKSFSVDLLGALNDMLGIVKGVIT